LTRSNVKYLKKEIKRQMGTDEDQIIKMLSKILDGEEFYIAKHIIKARESIDKGI
jgi:hypothetical protein